MALPTCSWGLALSACLLAATPAPMHAKGEVSSESIHTPFQRLGPRTYCGRHLQARGVEGVSGLRSMRSMHNMLRGLQGEEMEAPAGHAQQASPPSLHAMDLGIAL